jgi:signal transduction histidine kinase
MSSSTDDLLEYDIKLLLDDLVDNNRSQKTLRQKINSTYDRQRKQIENMSYSFNNILESDGSELKYESEYTYNKKNSEPREFHIRISVCEHIDDSPCFMVQISDIGERVKLQEEKIGDQIKTMMFCSISHELRTPLNQIKGMTELSQNTHSVSKIHQYLKISDRASSMLLHKIDDILDFYEIESNKFVIKSVHLSLNHFLQEIDSLMRPQVEEKGLFYSAHVATNLIDNVTFDELRVKRVIINLLNNAIKYTQSGFITLIVSKSSDNSIRFSISDTGCGIAKEKQQTLFKLFGKFKESGNSAVKLGGLGLSISQVLLNKLGFVLKCSSSENVGTRFYFDISVPESLPDLIKVTPFEEDEDEKGYEIPKPYQKGLSSYVTERSANIIVNENQPLMAHFNISKKNRKRSNSMTIILRNHEIHNPDPVDDEEDDCDIKNCDEYDIDARESLITYIPEFLSTA